MTEFKTEKEKMIAGELYFANDPELVSDRMFARSQSQIINQAESAELRSQLLKETFGRTGKKSIWSQLSILITDIIYLSVKFLCKFQLYIFRCQHDRNR